MDRVAKVGNMSSTPEAPLKVSTLSKLHVELSLEDHCVIQGVGGALISSYDPHVFPVLRNSKP